MTTFSNKLRPAVANRYIHRTFDSFDQFLCTLVASSYPLPDEALVGPDGLSFEPATMREMSARGEEKMHRWLEGSIKDEW